MKTEADRDDLDIIEVDRWYYEATAEGLIESIEGSLSTGRPVVLNQDYAPIYKTVELREHFVLKSRDYFVEIEPGSESP